MAHTLDTSTETNAQTGAPITFNYTCGAGTTGIVLSIVVAGNSGRAGGAPTIDGVAMTQRDQLRTAVETNVEIWEYCAERLRIGRTVAVSIPNTGTAKTCHIVTASGKAAEGYKSVYDNATGTNNTTANPSVSLDCADGAFVVNRLGHGDTSPTNYSNQTGTLLQNQDHGAYSSEARYTIKSGAGSFTFSLTVGADDWAMCIVSLKEDAHTHPAVKITQYRRAPFSGRRYGSFADKPAAGGANYETPADSITLSEVLALQSAKTLAETATLTEAAIRQALKPLAESLDLSENLLAGVVRLKAIEDTLSLSEVATLQTSRTVQESVSLVETASLKAGKTLAETLDLAESAVKQAQRQVAETLGLSENLVASAVKMWSGGDNISLTDYLVYRAGKVAQESLSLSEAQTKAVQHAFAESLTASEALVRQAQRSIAETVSLSESLAFAVAKHIAAENLSLSEQQSAQHIPAGGRMIGRVTQLGPGGRIGRRYGSFTGRAGAGSYSQGVADTLTLTEVLTSQLVKVRATNDALSMSEALDLLQINNIDDPNLALTEALHRRAGHLVGDAISLVEAASNRAGKSLTETLSTAESLRRDAQKHVAESLGLTEQFVVTRITDMIQQGADDALSLAETLSLRTGKSLVETVALTDALRRDSGKTIAEIAGLTETETRRALKPLADSLGLTEQLVAEVLNITSSFSTGDTLSFTEQLSAVLSVALQESLGITEDLGVDIRRAMAEAVGLTESVQRAITRAVGESLGLAEQLQAAIAIIASRCAWTARTRIYGFLAHPQIFVLTARTARA